MEWNAKCPSQWDWEHLFLFNAKATEDPRLQPTDWSGEGRRETNAGLFYSSGGSVFSGSELLHASSSRSSKSASINSSSNGESKTSKFTSEGSQEDSGGKKEMSKEELIGASPVIEPSVSGEPLLSLKLGKRLYFKDVYPGSDVKNPSVAGVPTSPLSTGKKCKSNSQSLQPPCCQVEGCNLDLSSAKDYHRKHRVCENHSKSPKVVVGGLERRFCQQCSRFHGLSEFDDKKRSCRRRLSDHNARRRKPHPEAVKLNSSGLSSSPYDGMQRLSSFGYSRSATNLTWQDMHGSKLPQTKDFLMMPAKAGGANGRVHHMSSTFTVLSDDSSGLSTPKALSIKTVNPGIEDSNTLSDLNDTQDFHRALSLLSTNSWASYETKPISLEHTNHVTHAGITQPMAHSMLQHLPLASSEYWQPHQQPSDSNMCISDCDNSIRFQDSQLLKAPYESGFLCSPSQ